MPLSNFYIPSRKHFNKNRAVVTKNKHIKSKFQKGVFKYFFKCDLRGLANFK